MLFVSIIIVGCDFFQAPLSLFQELLPLAIKYAPYALMFIEAPDEKLKDPNIQFCAEFDKITNSNKNETYLYQQIASNLRKNSGKKLIVVAIHIDSNEKIDMIKKWVEKNKNTYNISIDVVNHDISNNDHYKKIEKIISIKKNIIFIADSHLSELSYKQDVHLDLADLGK